jgi:hypothetical protein
LQLKENSLQTQFSTSKTSLSNPIKIPPTLPMEGSHFQELLLPN